MRKFLWYHWHPQQRHIPCRHLENWLQLVKNSIYLRHLPSIRPKRGRKNHLGLIEAAATLRDKHTLHIPLVFSGRKSDYYPSLKKRINDLGLAGQVQFLGFVTPLELQSLYRLCRCVIIPTKFEAASFPLWEAFLAGAPTACSNITSLPRQAGIAALTFDPSDENEIADCLRRLWEDGELRTRLAKHGRENVSCFTWKKTALCFRAQYRRILDLELSSEDNAILSAEPIL